MPSARLETSSPADVHRAEAFAWAGQILAEMLGLVCHRDYFTFPDHMVNPINPYGLPLGVCDAYIYI